MGTGIVSILLHAIPWQAAWLHYLSVIVFILNIALFLGILTATLMRVGLYPSLWFLALRHPVQVSRSLVHLYPHREATHAGNLIDE